MKMANVKDTLKYRKTQVVEIVGKGEAGYIIQNVGKPDDQWEIPYEVFNASYVGFRDGKDPEIEKNFTYHAPKPGQPEIYTEIRDAMKELAYLINEKLPKCREKSLAMTKLEEAMFWTNAGIARN